MLPGPASTLVVEGARSLGLSWHHRNERINIVCRPALRMQISPCIVYFRDQEPRVRTSANCSNITSVVMNLALSFRKASGAANGQVGCREGVVGKCSRHLSWAKDCIACVAQLITGEVPSLRAPCALPSCRRWRTVRLAVTASPGGLWSQ